jgi:Flp pilus assembly pilin Flp
MPHVLRQRDERGATTAEYAVATIGCTAFALCIGGGIAPYLEQLVPQVWDLDELLRSSFGPLSKPFFGMRIPW